MEAFIDAPNGERLNIDDSVDLGDIVVYDGKTFHGVEDIDPHKKLSLNLLMEGSQVLFHFIRNELMASLLSQTF